MKKFICWLLGHDWNAYAKYSVYKYKYCNRCKIEVEK